MKENTKQLEIAIILPAFNEEMTIQDVIKGFHASCPQASIYVVDNNSADQTNRIAKQTLSENQISGDVFFVKEQGKANAIRYAFRVVDADIYVMVDADLTYSPMDLEKLLCPIIEDKADMVVGNRLSQGIYKKENKRPFHNFGNHLVRFIINFFFKADLKDIMSGYRVFNKFFVKNYPITCNGFELETDLTLHALDKKMRIEEVDISYKDRPEGSESKLHTFKDGSRIIFLIFRMLKDFRPVPFFLSLSFIFLFFSLIIGAPVIIEFLETKFIHKVPSAILASGLMIIAFVLFSIGLILDTVTKQYRSNYEHQLLVRK